MKISVIFLTLIGSSAPCVEIRQCISASLQRKRARSLQTIRRVEQPLVVKVVSEISEEVLFDRL